MKKAKSLPKKKKRAKYNLKSRITSALRRIWFYGPQRREAAKLAKDNGNKCAICNTKKDKLQIDHIAPVVPVYGFDNWSNYIDRLFCDSSKLRAICEDCHKAHTTTQRILRNSKKNIDKLSK